MKVLFIAPYPIREAPSQRFRYEQYLPFLEENNIQWEFRSFWSMSTWKILYHKGKKVQKALGLIAGFMRRIMLLFTMGKYDFVFIHREATPIGPPVIEWIMAKILRKKIIYDFDDAIWLPNASSVNSFVIGLKAYGKVKAICKWAYKVSCGNDYLCDYARQYNSNVILIPTTIDTDYHKPAAQKNQSQTLVIGWTGSQSTIGYIDQLIPVLAELEKLYNFEFRVISNRNPQLKLKSFRFIPWKKETEINALQQFDIGVMPLPDDKWARGKCGFKGLQYMALEIPTIMSPVGVNTKIIEQGKNGFLANTHQEWLLYLTNLINAKELRLLIGKAGRQTVIEQYSVMANRQLYVGLLQGPVAM